MEGSPKQVKVDNWGIFFLQRLQQFYIKGEYCDLTLQFSSNEQIKVHRLVVNACTEYFQHLEKKGQNVAGMLRMPDDLQAEVVIPIINFMYTGRLEFRAELHSKLYSTAQQMNMTVLTKLLDAQTVPNRSVPKPVLPAVRTVVKKSPPVMAVRKPPPKPDPNLPDTLPGRKLPIWKRLLVPANSTSYIDDSSSSSFTDHEGPSRLRADELHGPTRFEFPPELDLPEALPFTTAFDDLSYESKPLVRLPDLPRPEVGSAATSVITSTPARTSATTLTNRVVSFEEVRRTATNKRPMATSTPVMEPAAKRSKVLDLQDVKEFTAEHRRRKDLLEPEESSEDVDDDLAGVDLSDDDEEEEDGGAAVDIQEHLPPPILAVPQKSILKSQVSHEETPSPSLSLTSPSKKVRFFLETPHSKENDTKTEEEPSLPAASSQPKKTSTTMATTAPTTMSASTVAGSGNLSNHAKIISEVLKKYPNLVKNNKNIKLKIMQRGGQMVPAVTVDGDRTVKSKVSYVVLKSDVAGKGKSGVVLKRGSVVEPIALGAPPPKPMSGAENVTGPWLCHSCGSNEEPINFDTYYLYRRHLHEVHNEKIDARICEHCGHRASKRNLLLYHLYTKHGVPPPRNCQFPRCDQCEYVALSESLLIKHRNNHSNNRDFVCKVCNAAFKSNGALQGHIQANLHSDPLKKLYECPYCQKPFVRNINLKAHIRSAHKERSEEEGEVMDVPVLEKPGPALPSGATLLAEAPSLEPSSEAEALSNVASGIATSLGLTESCEQTLIVLDDNQEYILQSPDGSTVQQQTKYILQTTDGDPTQQSTKYILQTSPGDVVQHSTKYILQSPGGESVQHPAKYILPSSAGDMVQHAAKYILQASQGDGIHEPTKYILHTSQADSAQQSTKYILQTSTAGSVQQPAKYILQTSGEGSAQQTAKYVVQASEGSAVQEPSKYVSQSTDGVAAVSQPANYILPNSESESVPQPSGQEYIVPEILAGEEHVYTDLPTFEQQPEVAQTSVSVPTTSAEDLTMILSDHDYADDSGTSRATGDGMMIFITQPGSEVTVQDGQTVLVPVTMTAGASSSVAVPQSHMLAATTSEGLRLVGADLKEEQKLLVQLVEEQQRRQQAMLIKPEMQSMSIEQEVETTQFMVQDSSMEAADTSCNIEESMVEEEPLITADIHPEASHLPVVMERTNGNTQNLDVGTVGVITQNLDVEAVDVNTQHLDVETASVSTRHLDVGAVDVSTQHLDVGTVGIGTQHLDVESVDISTQHVVMGAATEATPHLELPVGTVLGLEEEPQGMKVDLHFKEKGLEENMGEAAGEPVDQSFEQADAKPVQLRSVIATNPEFADEEMELGGEHISELGQEPHPEPELLPGPPPVTLLQPVPRPVPGREAVRMADLVKDWDFDGDDEEMELTEDGGDHGASLVHQTVIEDRGEEQQQLEDEQRAEEPAILS